MLRWITLPVLPLFLTLLYFCAAELNIPKELVNEKNIGGAGVNARLSQKGVNYVASFLANSLIVEIATTNVDTAPAEVQVASKGKLSVEDMTLNVGNSAQTIKTATHAPNIASVEISGMSFVSKGQLVGKLGEAAINTSFELQSTNSVVRLNVSVSRNSQGAPNLRVSQCQLVLTQVTDQVAVTLDEATTAQDIKTDLQESLNKRALELLDGLICSRINFIMEDRLNDRIGLLSPKITLAHINDDVIVDELVSTMRARRQRSATGATMEKRNAALMNSFNMSRADSLFLDYTLVMDPSADDLGLMLKSSGEVSFRGRGGTPFGPINITLPKTVNEDFMLQMGVSDFIPNSLMYHGHTIGLFNTRIDPTTPHFGPIMRTSCASSGLLFCLGDLFPTLKRLHPNHRLALFFNTVQAPVIKFHPASAGGIKFSLMGKIVVILIDNLNAGQETQVGEMGIDVAAHMKLRLSSTSVRPRISLDSIRLSTLSPSILLQDELDDAVLLSREVLQRMVNDILQDGIPIPVHPLFKLNKPKVKVMERALLLQTNIDLNERLMKQLTASDLLEQQKA